MLFGSILAQSIPLFYGPVNAIQPVASEVCPLNKDAASSYEGLAPTSSFSYQPVSGPESTIVILVRFTDVANTKSRAEIDNMVFNLMDNYYRAVSFSKTSITGTSTATWYLLQNAMSYYLTNRWWLIRDAVALADWEVDFRLYSHIIVVHAGNDSASTGKPGDIKSCHYAGLSIVTNDGIFVTGGSIVAETDPVGVFAHEYAHDFGVPDLYNYGKSGDDDFVGKWCLMAAGDWNGNPPGTSPAHFMSWCKIRLGWTPLASVRTISAGSVTVALDPLEVGTAGTQAIKAMLPNGTYYLVENRQQTGFDSALPGQGVLVSYVDENLGTGQGIVKVKTSSTLNNAALQTGQAFQDLPNRLSIIVSSATSSSYQIKATYGHILTVATGYSNVTLKVDGIEYRTDQNGNAQIVVSADQHTVEAVTPTLSGIGTRYIFTGWGDGSLSNSRTVDVSGDMSLTANYKTQYCLTVNTNQAGTLTSGAGWYDSGASANVTASTPLDHGNGTRRVFTYWSGDVASNSSSIIIIMSRQKTVTANWKTQYLVTISLNNADGTKTFSPTNVTLVDPRGANQTFVSYSNVWMDSGVWTIKQVTWGGVNVNPEPEPKLTIVAPQTWTVYCKVYAIRVTVKDIFNLPVLGVSVSVTLPNQTTITAQTDISGVATIELIPYGNYSVKTTYLMQTSTAMGHTAQTTTVSTQVMLSLPVIGAIIAPIIIGIGIVIMRKKKMSRGG